MKRLFSLIALLLFFATQLSAQITITVGEGEDVNQGPIAFNKRRSMCEVVYLSSELISGEITSISYYYPVYSSFTDPSPEIYMAEVPRSSFTDTYDWEQATFVLVYSGADVVYNRGWTTIQLTTPFVYSGTGNLVVLYRSNRPMTSSGRYFNHTPTTNTTMLIYADNYATEFAGTVPSEGGSTGYTAYTSRPNTRFTINPDENYCYPVEQVNINRVWYDEAEISWSHNENGTGAYGLEYKQTWQTTWTVESNNINDTVYLLAGLLPMTDYDVRIHPVCSNGNSLYTEATLRTYPSPEQCIPIPYTETFTGYAISDWSFLNQGQNRWYVGQAENCEFDQDGNPVAGESLYISNDYGETASYDPTSASVSYFYGYLWLQNNTRYGLQFDWKGGDAPPEYSMYDYLRVYLLPANYELSTNALPSTGALTNRLGGETTWQEFSTVFDNVEEGAYKLVFAWTNNNSGSSSAGAIDNIYITDLACKPVDSLTVTWANLTQSVTANVNIYSNNTNVTYVLEYRAENETQWTQLIGTSPFSIENLSHLTKYYFKATSVCTDGYSIVSQPQHFFSPYAPLPVPYTQNFEEPFVAADGITSNRSTPVYWWNIDGVSFGYFFQSTFGSYAHSGTSCVGHSSNSNATGSCSDWLISPVINLSGNEQMKYYIRLAYSYSDGRTPTIDVMACDVSQSDIQSMSDTSRFTLVSRIRHDDLTTDYQEAVAALADYSGPTRIALAVRQGVENFYLDDFSVEAVPPCPPVYDVSAEAYSEDSILVFYNTYNLSDSDVVIAYQQDDGSSAFNPATATLLTIPQTEQSPVFISGLTPGETYFIALKNACEGGTFGNVLSVTLPFETEPLPYSQDFDDLETDHGFTFGGTGINVWVVGSAANNTFTPEGELTENGRALYISNNLGTDVGYNSNSTTNAYAYSPMFSFGEGVSFIVSFDCKVGGEASCDYLSVYLVPFGQSPANNNLILYQEYSTTPAWHNYSITLPSSYAYGVYQLVFYWKNDIDYGTQPGAIIDNIRIESIPCGVVNSVSVQLLEAEEGSDPHSMQVNISDGNTTDSGVTYILKYKNTQDENYTIISPLSASDFPYTINNISHSTQYTVAVASVCPDGFETSFVSAGLTVPCGANSLPWSEEFDTNPFSGMTCWSQKSGMLPQSGTVQTSSLSDTYATFWHLNTTIQGSGASVLRTYITSTNVHNWLISPTFDLGDGSTTYAVYLRAIVAGNNQGSAQDLSNSRIVFLFSTDEGLSWEVADAVAYSYNPTHSDNNIADLYNTWSVLVAKFVDQYDNPLTGRVKFAVYVESTAGSGNNYLYIDNVSISEWSSCVKPYNVEVLSFTTTTANVTFDETSGATSWEYVIAQGENVNFDTCTPVAFTTTDIPLQITGLTPQTTYTLAIRSVCSDDYSVWSDPVVFRTWAIPTPMPYTTGFEDAEDNDAWYISGTPGLQWAIGTATFEGEGESGTSAYVSSDRGQSYHTNVIMGGSKQYLWRDFDFGTEGDHYTLSFSWKGEGDVYNTNNLNGGLAVIIQDISDPMPQTVTYPPSGDVIAILYGHTDWTTERIALPDISGVKRLIFFSWGYSSYGEAAVPAAVDNVIIDIQSCPVPTSVEVSFQTRTTAQVFWTGTADSYIIHCRTSNETETSVFDATSSPYLLTGLDPETEYVVKVQGVCGLALSNFSDSVVFRTACYDVIDEYPFVEGFENGLSCWTLVNSNPEYTWEVSEYGNFPVCYPHEGNNLLRFRCGYYASGVSSTLISPAFEAVSGLKLSFWMFNPPAYQSDRLEVYINNAPSENGATLLMTEFHDGDNSWEEKVIDLPEDISGTQYILIKAISDRGYDIHIDDFSLTLPCNEPSELSVVSVGSSSATLSWSGEASQYQVRLNNGNVSTVSGNTVSYDNLTPLTNYTFKIRAICGDNSYSEWVTVLFTTLERENEIVPPSVVTLAATDVTNEGATLHGTIVAGNEEITERGFKYRTTGSTAWETIPSVGNAMTVTLHYLYPSTAYEYKAFATTPSGTTDGNVIYFTTSQVGLLSAESTSPSITIYPNPASRSVTISAGGVESGAKIVVSDMQGRIILSDDMTSETYELSVANMTSGVYYIRVIDGASIHTQKLIVE